VTPSHPARRAIPAGYDAGVNDPRADVVRHGYAPVARAYREQLLDELAGKPLDRAFLDAFAEQTRVGRIVEVGCGPGQIARYLADHGAAVEGLDLSPEMIAEATASHPGLAFRVGDMFALPYDDASLRGVVAFYAIVHLRTEELGAPFREIHRVLAPGGMAAIAFHAGDDTVHASELFGCATSLDFMFHRPEAVVAALVEAGLTLEARLDRAPYPGAEHPSQRCYLLARR
jgi:SAM-dependent methyltransferase